MALVTSSRFFQERTALIQELQLKKCPKKSGCQRICERICQLWRAFCEWCCPKIYQKKLDKQLEEIKTQLANDQYRKKVEDFYNKFMEEAKAEALSCSHTPELEKLFQMPLNTKDAIREFSHKLQHQFGHPLQGKLLLLADCFDWKEKMGRQREEVNQLAAKVKNSSMIKKVMEVILVQSKDVKSYSHFRQEFAKALSESTLQIAGEAICKLDQEKNKHFKKFSECKMQLKATKSAFSDLYGDWLKGMVEIKKHMSVKNCSENLELLSFWKKKLQELLKGKEHLDLFIEMLVKFDRICLNLMSKDDSNGKKLVASGLSVSLSEAATSFVSNTTKVRELIDSPKQVHDQISKLLDRLISKRLNFLEVKSGQFLTEDEEKLLLEIKQCKMKRCYVPKGENSLFDACMLGIKLISGIAPEFKEMDGKTFRKALYEHMKSNSKDYFFQLVKQLKNDPSPIYLISEELLEKNLTPTELEVELVTDGAYQYLEKMGELSIYPGDVEIKAASKLLNVPIHVHEMGAIQGSLKGLQLLRINKDFDVLQNM